MAAILKNFKLSTFPTGIKLILSLLIVLSLPIISIADTRISTASGGDWNSTSTWVGGLIPLAGDDVVIATSGTGAVTVDGLQTCVNLTIKSSGRLIIIGTNTLNVTGTVQMPRPKSGYTSELNVDEGTLNVTGLFTMSASGGTRYANLNITSGTANLSGLTTSGAASRIIFNGNGVLNLSGDLIGTKHTLEADLGTVNFTDTSDNNIWAKTYHNLGISGSGVKTLAGNTIVTGITNIDGELNLSNHDLILSGAGNPLVVDGILRPAIGKVIYSGENEQNVAGIPYSNLSFTGSGTKILAAGTLVFVGQDLAIDSPTLLEDDASIEVVRDMIGEGTLEMENGVLSIGRSNLRTGIFIPGSSTVQYSRPGTQTVRAVEYFNLNLTESGDKTIAQGEQIIINNDLDVSSPLIIPANTSLDIRGNLTGTADVILDDAVLTIEGDWKNTGNFVSGNSTVRYAGKGDQIVAGQDYYNLEIVEGGIKSLDDDALVRNVLNIGADTELNLDNHDLILSGSGIPLVNNGEFSPAASTVRYTNSSETEIAAVNYYNLDATGGPRKLAETDTIGVSGTFTPGAGDYKTINSTVSFNGFDQTIPPFTFYHVILMGGGEKFIDSVVNVKSLKLKNGSMLKVNYDEGAKIIVID